MNRLFIAAQIDPETQADLYRLLSRKPDPSRLFRLTPAQNLHITLKFLGEIPESLNQPLIAAVRQIAGEFTPPEMVFSGGGVFPSLSNARILWIGLRPKTALNQLAMKIESACEKIGLPRERKPFNAHVTLARLNRPPQKEEIRLVQYWLDILEKNDPLLFQMKNVTIFKSHLAQKSPVYQTLYTCNCESC